MMRFFGIVSVMASLCLFSPSAGFCDDGGDDYDCDYDVDDSPNEQDFDDDEDEQNDHKDNYELFQYRVDPQISDLDDEDEDDVPLQYLLTLYPKGTYRGETLAVQKKGSDLIVSEFSKPCDFAENEDHEFLSQDVLLLTIKIREEISNLAPY